MVNLSLLWEPILLVGSRKVFFRATFYSLRLVLRPLHANPAPRRGKDSPTSIILVSVLKRRKSLSAQRRIAIIFAEIFLKPPDLYSLMTPSAIISDVSFLTLVCCVKSSFKGCFFFHRKSQMCEFLLKLYNNEIFEMISDSNHEQIQSVKSYHLFMCLQCR